MRWLHFSACAAVAVLLSVKMSLAAEPAAKAPAATEVAKNAAARPKITISKETTYITEPLRPDGYPDYVAALDARTSKEVTPANNSAVPLLEALGPNELGDEKTSERIYRALGMQALPAEGKYVVSQAEIIDRWKSAHPTEANEKLAALDEQFTQAQRQPWAGDELPLVAQWLAANERPLELAIEASRRPRYYWPVVTAGDDPSSGLIAARLLVEGPRELSRLLATRAMQLAKQGNNDAAWQDLLACHRLGRLMAQGWSLMDALVGYSMDGVAIKGDCALAHYGHPSAQQLEKMRADLRALPPFPELVDKIDQGDRFVYLDSTLLFAREGPAGPGKPGSVAGSARKLEDRIKWALVTADDSVIDWNVLLRIGNEWYDRVVASAKITECKERMAALQKSDSDMQALKAQDENPGSVLRSIFTSHTAAEYTSRRFGRMLVCVFLPTVYAPLVAEQRNRLMSEMDDTTLALTAYRASNGQYPEKVDQLVPKYLAKVPIDTFSSDGGPIRYRREGNAYVLWMMWLTDENEPPRDDGSLRPVPSEKPAAENKQ